MGPIRATAASAMWRHASKSETSASKVSALRPSSRIAAATSSAGSGRRP